MFTANLIFTNTTDELLAQNTMKYMNNDNFKLKQITLHLCT